MQHILLAVLGQKCPLLVKRTLCCIILLHSSPIYCASTYIDRIFYNRSIYLCSNITVLNKLFNKVCFITFGLFYLRFKVTSGNVSLHLMFNKKINKRKTIVHTVLFLFIFYHIESKSNFSVECFTVNMFQSDILIYKKNKIKKTNGFMNTESFPSIHAYGFGWWLDKRPLCPGNCSFAIYCRLKTTNNSLFPISVLFRWTNRTRYFTKKTFYKPEFSL